jgi:ankyrin repeat protein
MMSLKWKWFFEAPLAPAWRKRLELCLGVVLSGAFVVALSSTIPANPEKVAVLRGIPAQMSSPQPPGTAEVAEPLKPPQSAEIFAAAEAGDVVGLRTAYRPTMPLDGLLSLAARSGREDAVVWLLAHGANIHDQERSPTAPVLAADAFPKIVTLLREKGAVEPSLENAAEANAPHALMRALAAHPDDAKEHVSLRAVVGSPMGTAADKRFVVSKLLEIGANPNDAYGSDTSLGAAVRGCDPHGSENLRHDCMTIVRLLLNHGAHVTGDALGAALSLDDTTRSAPLEALLDRPIAKGVTATALARATNVKADDLKRIVKLGVDWAWHDGEEDSALPLLEAVRRGDRDYARALIDAGAPVDVHFKDATCALAEALDNSASDNDRARIVELLVMRGANVNRRFPDGRTPLFAAAESGNIRVINFLLARGASVDDRVLDETALDAAEQHANISAARVIAAHGGRRAHPNAY